MAGSELYSSAILSILPRPKLEIVEQLIDFGVPFNVIDKDGQTPLFYAVEVITQDYDAFKELGLSTTMLSESLDVVKLLLKNGADPNLAGTCNPCSCNDNKCNIPLKIAIDAGYLELIHLLLVYEADVNRISRGGLGVPDTEKILRLILDFGAEIETAKMFNQWKRLNFVIEEYQIMRRIIKPEVPYTFVESGAKRNDGFTQRCLAECRRMACTYLYENDTHQVSYLSFLQASEPCLINFVEQKPIYNAFQNRENIHKQFPIFGGMLEAKFDKGMARKKHYHQATAVMAGIMRCVNNRITHGIIENIIKKLDQPSLATLANL